MSRLAVLLLTAAVATAQPPKPPATHQVKLDGQTFTLPVGFTIERVAGPPLVDRPVSASFDDRGRLYVTDSSGSNEKLTEQIKHPNHRVIRLEDTKGNGVFDKATVFADKMMFPEGILWYRGSVYVGAPPQIWKLTDTDDDGVADKREIWFDGKTMTGCGNDLHGPYLGPDGWIYWCKGAFAKQEYTLPNGKKFTTRASHIFRARPDGTGIEPVMTGGMDNPVGVAFLPNGERFFTTTFFQQPAAGHRDGLIHAIYGGIYGKDHDVIYDPDHKWTSPNLMPVMTHLGPAAPCGLLCYQSNAFGVDYTSNLFACQFNMRKVSRHLLKPSGSTYVTEDYDFLVSDNTDFHPTDVIEDADGSLLVVNTGGWYKLCCPSSQLVKADVLGAIYRVRKAGAISTPPQARRPVDLSRVPSSELLNLYGSRPEYRDQIVGAIAKRVAEGELRLSLATTSPTAVELACAVVWALCRSNGDGAREASRALMGHADDSVGIAALNAASLWRDRDSVPRIIGVLNHRSPPVRRVAAEALGRIGDDRAVGPLIKALADEKNDRTLDHSLTYALIELDNREFLKNSLDNGDPRVRRACLAALDQLGEKLDPKVVLEAMKSKDAALKETAQWIAGRHPEWADDLARVFAKQLGDKSLTPADRDALVLQLARFAKTPAVQDFLGRNADQRGTSVEPRRTIFRAMARSGYKELPELWATALTNVVRHSTGDVLADALATLRAVPVPKNKAAELTTALAAVSVSGAPAEVRLTAMAAVPGGMPSLNDAQFKLLLASLDRERPAAERGLAADVLSRAKLSPDQLSAVIALLPIAGPLEIDRLLGTFAQTKDEAIGRKLLAALKTPEIRPALRADGVKERIKHFSPAVQKEAESLYALLNAEYEHQRARLDETLKNLQPGDIRRGQAVFNSTKTSCLACHTIGYVGGKIGPDLTRIGGIRTERDLLESILFPSASFVRSYEPLTVTTRNGQTFNGIPKKDAPDEIVLILAADKEARIAREDVEEVRPGKVSIMPDGLDKQLTPQELADLIAFLKACK
ncbi:MAG: HEAT repeat domain-containing protein [Zavarzinella sp.]|nr:HEAT repeat domain-containing protein [Zavarzinella sp.]